MELGLLNLTPAAGTVDDAGFAVPETVDGAAFTALLAQLGLMPAAPGDPAATATAAPAPASALTPAPEELVKLASLPAAASVPVPTAKLEAAPAATREGAESPAPAPAEEANPLDLASLGLPPLMAALLAPAPQGAPAAPIAATVVAPASQGSAALQAAAVPIAVVAEAPPGVAVQVSPAAAKAEVVERIVPVELSPAAGLTPLAALTRRLIGGPVVPLAGTERPSKGEGATAPTVDPASLSIVRLPQPQSPLAAPAALAESLATAQPAAEPAPVVEVPIEQHLDLARDGEWLDQLAKDIARTATGEGLLRFRLNPEHLGSLQVEVTQGASGASVRLTADTEAARTVIADARPQLLAEARAQGVRIAEAHVDLGSGGQPQGGGAQREGRELPERTYLTSWKPESAEEEATPPRRSASERYA